MLTPPTDGRDGRHAPPNTLSNSLMTIFSEHGATNDLLEATNDFARAKESKSVQIESAISVRGVPHLRHLTPVPLDHCVCGSSQAIGLSMLQFGIKLFSRSAATHNRHTHATR